MNSLLLALFVLGLGLGLALVIYKTGHTAGWEDDKTRRVALFFALGGVAASIFAFTTDRHLRQTTLFEVVIERPAEGEAQSRTFHVRSAQVEHTFLYAPVQSRMGTRLSPVTLAVSLRDTEGETLLEETFEFEPIRVRDRADQWRGQHLRFTPTETGPYHLTVTRVAGHECDVHLRIADPTLTDGERAPGY